MPENNKYTWDKLICTEQKKDYFKKLTLRLDQQKKLGKVIYPPENKIFEALNLTKFSNVKVIILGQDPYHGENQAHGLAFSVPENIAIPPSLRNIFKACNLDLNIPIPNHGNLEHLAKQGVLLLNTVLTVEKNQPHSHANIGWESFTNEIISQLNARKNNLIFLLWGKHAQKKSSLINSNKHLILTAPHPSPLSAHRGFLSCEHFSKTNKHLKNLSILPINWS